LRYPHPQIDGRRVDGFVLAEFLKDKGFKAAIVMLSSVDMTLLKETQKKYKPLIDAFYRKPLTQQEFKELIKRYALKKQKMGKA
jgi:NAD(P)H-hydrate repair Nnr-like enzyme with NAD(P)H-hydrate epimerase domain